MYARWLKVIQVASSFTQGYTWSPDGGAVYSPELPEAHPLTVLAWGQGTPQQPHAYVGTGYDFTGDFGEPGAVYDWEIRTYFENNGLVDQEGEHSYVIIHWSLGEEFIGERPEDGAWRIWNGGSQRDVTIGWDPDIPPSSIPLDDIYYRDFFWLKVQVYDLFTDQSDAVDFNSLSPDQRHGLEANRDAYNHSLNGDDRVVLPTADKLSELGISFTTFDLGAGNDTIVATDYVTDVDGGAGEDEFDFRGADYRDWAGKQFHIDGGADDDVAYLPFRPNNYIVDIDLRSSWAETITTIKGVTSSTAVGYARQVEKVVFADKLDNKVSLSGGTLAGEATSQMVEVYDGLEVARNRRGWHDVTPMELGMPAVGASGTGTYKFAPGLFEFEGPGIVGLLGNDSDVSITAGLAGPGDTRTLMIAFKGSDPTDLRDWAYDLTGVQPFYEKHRPLVDKLIAYLKDSANGIEKVVVTGHSLGGAMTQHLLAELRAEVPGLALQGYTFGTIGAIGARQPAPDLINFLHPGDIANVLNAATDTRAGSMVYLQTEGSLNDFNVYAWAANRITGGNLLTGMALTVFANAVSLHFKEGYATDMASLMREAGNTGSLFYTSALAAALRSGTGWNGADVHLFAGDNRANTYLIKPQDDYVLGGGGNDRFTLSTASGHRFIDGGAGSGDILVVQGKQAGYRIVGSGTGVSTLQKKSDGGWTTIADLKHIELIAYQDDLDRLVGNERIQHLVPESPGSEVRIKPGYDGTRAGSGAMKITGTSGGETLTVDGNGAKTIAMGGGNDVVLVTPHKQGATADKIVIDGGAGADLMQGGKGNETFHVDNPGDVVGDAGGRDTVIARVDYLLPDGIETLTLAGNATSAIGNASPNTIRGNARNNYLDGLGGNDTISGGDGRDTIVGGSGKDSLAGGKHADTFFFSVAPGSANADTIGDFTPGSDRLMLDVTAYAAIGSKLEGREFHAGAGATRAHDDDDRIIYDRSSGRLYYDADGKGGAAAVLFATLANKPTGLSHTDFLIA